MARVRVRYRFQTNGTVLDTGEATIRVGIDVVVAESECASDMQCDDDNACTQDRCVSGACERTLDSADGLVAWWPGDADASEVVADHDGAPNPTIGFAPGVARGAFSFETSSDAVLVPASPGLEVLSFMIDAWIYPSELSSERPILEFAREMGPAGVHFWLNTLPEGGGTDTRTLFANVRGGDDEGHHIGSGPGVVTAFVWQHVAVTFNQPTGEASLYVNGESVMNKNLGIFTPQTSYPVHLGRRPEGSADGSAGARFAGLLDEWAYGIALSRRPTFELSIRAALRPRASERSTSRCLQVSPCRRRRRCSAAARGFWRGAIGKCSRRR